MSTMLAAPPLSVSPEQRGELDRLARSTSAPHRTVLQAKVLLLAAEGVANYEIARRVGVSSNSVRSWRRRFEAEGVSGVGRIEKGRGRRSWLPEGTDAEIVRVTMQESPDDTSTHWTTRTLAESASASARTPSLASGEITSCARGGPSASRSRTIPTSRRSWS